MDRSGWVKTKKGRRTYHKPKLFFSRKDILRILDKQATDAEEYDPYGLLLDIYERLVVSHFQSIPLVSPAWRLCRQYYETEHALGRPLTLLEQWRVGVQALFDRHKKAGHGKEEIQTLVRAAYAYIFDFSAQLRSGEPILPDVAYVPEKSGEFEDKPEEVPEEIPEKLPGKEPIEKEEIPEKLPGKEPIKKKGA
jgi:hypothetical protein